MHHVGGRWRCMLPNYCDCADGQEVTPRQPDSLAAAVATIRRATERVLAHPLTRDAQLVTVARRAEL